MQFSHVLKLMCTAILTSGSGGVVSAMKPHGMYGSALESAGTYGAASPRIEPALDRAAVDYHPISDGLLKKSVESLINHGVLSESGSAGSVRGLGDTLLREKDGAAIAGSGGVVSAIKPPYMYGSALESAGTDRAAAPRIEPASDRATVDYHPNNGGLLIESVESLIDHGVLSGSGSAVSVLGLGETLLREKDDADIESSYGPIHDGVRHDHAVTIVDRKLQSGPCPILSAVEFRTQISAYIVSCDSGSCESGSFGSKPINEWCTTSITDMSEAFSNVQNFQDDISGWDVSSVTDMYNMFRGSEFNQDLNAWNVSSVTRMYGMFYSAAEFNQDISAWDVSSVISMYAMFRGAPFNRDISAWDVSSVTSMFYMFLYSEFNEDLNAWDVASVTTMNRMFLYSKFNQDLNAWNVSSVNNMYAMFHHAIDFNQNLCAWDLSRTTNTQIMFEGALKFNQDLCSWRGTFQYDSSDVKTFKDTACSTTAQPSEESIGPFCAQCSDTSTSTCIMTPMTASPTTASPTTTSPTTTSPTESPLRKIDFKSVSIGFNASTINEGLILTYEIGKGETHVSSLYAGPCLVDRRTMPTIKSTGVLTKREDLIMESANPLMSTLELSYDVNKSLIATSNIWNDTTSQIKLCQVLQLVEEVPQMEEKLVIVEDIRDVTIGINSFLNFSLGVDLVGAIVNAVNQTTSLADFIYAYICSGDDTMKGFDEDFELEPNENLHVCFMSKSTNVEISQVTSMVIEGTGTSGSTTELLVVASGKAYIKSITSLRYVNATSAICTTRVPTNMFDYELADAKITIKGSVAMNLQADAEERKLLTEDQVSTKNRDLQQLDNDMDEEAQFGISVNLKRSDIVKEEHISFLNSASKILASIVPLVVVAYVVW